MAAKYKLVLRKNLTKGAEADSKLYYASANVAGVCTMTELCETIASVSTASSGDVKCVLDGLCNILAKRLMKGEVVQVADFGNFQLQFGSTGTITEKEFSSALIKKRRVVFRPGKQLQAAMKNATFEKIVPEVVEKECDRPHAV